MEMDLSTVDKNKLPTPAEWNNLMKKMRYIKFAVHEF